MKLESGFYLATQDTMWLSRRKTSHILYVFGVNKNNQDVSYKYLWELEDEQRPKRIRPMYEFAAIKPVRLSDLTQELF